MTMSPQLRHYHRNRAAFFADKACVDCGATERLEIDHVDPTTKIDNHIWSWAPVRRQSELAKCVVRCQPCHSERHAKERRIHGTRTRYDKGGCRCDACRAAKSEANRKAWALYRERRHAKAGQCEAQLKNFAGRCLKDAKWSVLTTHGEYALCGIHSRIVPMVLAVEPLDG